PVGAVRPVFREVIALGAEVVVDDVEEDGEPGRVARVHQATEPARAAIGRLRSVEVDAIVTPVTPARELGDVHQLDRRQAPDRQRGAQTPNAAVSSRTLAPSTFIRSN